MLAGIKDIEGRLSTKMDLQGVQITSAKVDIRDLTSRVICVESSLDARIDATVCRAVDKAVSNRLGSHQFLPLGSASDPSLQPVSGPSLALVPSGQMSFAAVASSASLSQGPSPLPGAPPLM